jgi:uncharacterized protein
MITDTIVQRLFIQRSPIHGTGCFASSEIHPGEVIVEYVGEKINREEAVKRDIRSSPAYSEYILEINPDTFIDGKITGNFSRFINHSCDPNCQIWRVETHALIVASRRISFGEELTMDYSFDLAYRQPCRCGSKNCRGFI